MEVAAVTGRFAEPMLPPAYTDRADDEINPEFWLMEPAFSAYIDTFPSALFAEEFELALPENTIPVFPELNKIN